MNILVVNDDGYTAPGIAALVRELRKEHDVFVCAPKENQSAVGHGLTLRRLLHAERVTVFDDDAKNSERELKPVTAFWVDGTPADCVRVALGNLSAEPDIVISGINQAPNLGTDVRRRRQCSVTAPLRFQEIRSVRTILMMRRFTFAAILTCSLAA